MGPTEGGSGRLKAFPKTIPDAWVFALEPNSKPHRWTPPLRGGLALDQPPIHSLPGSPPCKTEACPKSDVGKAGCRRIRPRGSTRRGLGRQAPWPRHSAQLHVGQRAHGEGHLLRRDAGKELRQAAVCQPTGGGEGVRAADGGAPDPMGKHLPYQSTCDLLVGTGRNRSLWVLADRVSATPG